MAKRKTTPRQAGPAVFQIVRKLALALPDVKESTSYGTPAFKVRGKLFARLHQDGESLVVRIDQRERVMRMQADPVTYYITDHYLNYPWILVRLASVSRDDLGELLKEAWQLVAPPRSSAQRKVKR
jgi:hypothetical protein